jgi:hypothetical protein
MGDELRTLSFTHHPSLILKGEDKMADQDKSENQQGAQGSTPTKSKDSETGDPGRTPGKAEGDEETVDEALSEKENKPLH